MRYLDPETDIRQGDPVLRLCFSWADFTETLTLAAKPEHGEFFATYSPVQDGGMVKITCCDASAMLKDCYGGYEQVVGSLQRSSPLTTIHGFQVSIRMR